MKDPGSGWTPSEDAGARGGDGPPAVLLWLPAVFLLGMVAGGAVVAMVMGAGADDGASAPVVASVPVVGAGSVEGAGPVAEPGSGPASSPGAGGGRAGMVMPAPGSGAGRHPVFDCRDFKHLPPAPEAVEGLKTIAELHQGKAALAEQEVQVRAMVMAVYPNILGRNWLRLCDAQDGAVLVTTSLEWVHPGLPVVARGKLVLDQHVGGAYSFPVLLDNATFAPEGSPAQGASATDL